MLSQVVSLGHKMPIKLRVKCVISWVNAYEDETVYDVIICSIAAMKRGFAEFNPAKFIVLLSGDGPDVLGDRKSVSEHSGIHAAATLKPL